MASVSLYSGTGSENSIKSEQHASSATPTWPCQCTPGPEGLCKALNNIPLKKRHQPGSFVLVPVATTDFSLSIIWGPSKNIFKKQDVPHFSFLAKLGFTLCRLSTHPCVCIFLMVLLCFSLCISPSWEGDIVFYKKTLQDRSSAFLIKKKKCFWNLG